MKKDLALPEREQVFTAAMTYLDDHNCTKVNLGKARALLTWYSDAQELDNPLFLRKVRTQPQIIIEQTPNWELRTRMAYRNNLLMHGGICPPDFKVHYDGSTYKKEMLVTGSLHAKRVNRMRNRGAGMDSQFAW